MIGGDDLGGSAGVGGHDCEPGGHAFDDDLPEGLRLHRGVDEHVERRPALRRTSARKPRKLTRSAMPRRAACSMEGVAVVLLAEQRVADDVARGHPRSGTRARTRRGRRAGPSTVRCVPPCRSPAPRGRRRGRSRATRSRCPRRTRRAPGRGSPPAAGRRPSGSRSDASVDSELATIAVGTPASEGAYEGRPPGGGGRRCRRGRGRATRTAPATTRAARPPSTDALSELVCTTSGRSRRNRRASRPTWTTLSTAARHGTRRGELGPSEVARPRRERDDLGGDPGRAELGQQRAVFERHHVRVGVGAGPRTVRSNAISPPDIRAQWST